MASGKRNRRGYLELKIIILYFWVLLFGIGSPLAQVDLQLSMLMRMTLSFSDFYMPNAGIAGMRLHAYLAVEYIQIRRKPSRCSYIK